MAQGNRSKEIWLVPKRISLHQTICLIDGIKKRNIDGRVWNPARQNDLGVNLKEWGATKDGKNISPQAIRTLVASIPQYLGFLYINTDTTPNSICLTPIGHNLWEKHKDELVKIKNLKEGKDSLITTSELVLHQLEKLQITNPIISKDCENILVFPFRFMLKVLLKTEYLDQEEIAYYLFKVRNDDEVDLVVNEINNFRGLEKDARKKLIDAFKKTHIGNITLVKASSATYYIGLCETSGIIERYKKQQVNGDSLLPALKIKEEYRSYVKQTLKNFTSYEAYDFKDNLSLWIDYIGNPNRMSPPIDVTLTNKTNSKLFLLVKDSEEKIESDSFKLVEAGEAASYPMFPNEEYEIELIDILTGKRVDSLHIIPTLNTRLFDINTDRTDHDEIISEEQIINDIKEHCDSNGYTKYVTNYLKVLTKYTGVDYSSKPALRGAYLEYYFYQYLSLLKEDGIIDDLVWNGHITKYGLPVAAPGGVHGTPDIVFSIKDIDFVLELTTIKAKSTQFSAEGSSVPDHIRIYNNSTGRETIGIFSAPIMHERNIAAMKSTIKRYDIKLNCLAIDELLEILTIKDKDIIVEKLSG